VAAIFGLWEWGVRAGLLAPYVYGQPSGVLAKAQGLIASGELFRHAWVTAQEAVIGLPAGLRPRLPLRLAALAVAARRSRGTAGDDRHQWRAKDRPRAADHRVVRHRMEAKIAIAAILTFIVSLIATYAGTQEVDNDFVRLLRSLGATRFQTWRKVVAPATLPWVVSALRLNVGFALIGAVVGEYISARRGSATSSTTRARFTT
jgi:NitT/TauT family transport system permease protein